MKILLVSDVIGWAWDRNAKALIKYLPEYEIYQGFEKCSKQHIRWHKSRVSDFDHVHCMGWTIGMSCANEVTAGVCSHNHYLLDHPWRTLFPRYQALTVNSPSLIDMVKSVQNNVYYCPNGVFHDLFVPVKKNRTKEFVVGWVGQETHGSFDRKNNPSIDIKGYQHVLLPLMDRFQGTNVRFKILKGNYLNCVPYDKMPLFFDDVDLQICTSFREGTPNPMFEAASCGKPLISTNVGAISEFINESGGGIIIDSYDGMDQIPHTIDRFEQEILKLEGDRDFCEYMGNKNRANIEKNWTWEIRAKAFIPMFEKMRELKGL